MTTTTSLEKFQQAPLDERRFFADGGLGIYVYDYDHGLTETYRVREPEEVTRARIPYVLLLAAARERYDVARDEARRLDSEATLVAREAWDRYRAVAEGARAELAEDEAAYDSANSALQAALSAASDDLAMWQRRFEVSQGHGLRAWRARRWCMATEPGARTRSAVDVAQAAERNAWERRGARHRLHQRDMKAAEGKYLDASVRNEAQTRAAAILARAEQELAHAYETAIEVTPVEACA